MSRRKRPEYDGILVVGDKARVWVPEEGMWARECVGQMAALLRQAGVDAYPLVPDRGDPIATVDAHPGRLNTILLAKGLRTYDLVEGLDHILGRKP